ncbi:hypothetical protein ACE60T_005646 [Salmonella enterica]
MAACSEEETALIINNDEKLPLSDAMASPEILPAGQCIPPWPQECISGEIFVSRGCGQVTGDITAPEGRLW